MYRIYSQKTYSRPSRLVLLPWLNGKKTLGCHAEEPRSFSFFQCISGLNGKSTALTSYNHYIVHQLLVEGWRFTHGIPVSSTSKTDCMIIQLDLTYIENNRLVTGYLEGLSGLLFYLSYCCSAFV